MVTRTVDVYAVLNAIFYVLVEGIHWRARPGDFPPWQTIYTNSLNLDYTSKKYVAPFDKGAATAGDPPICSATLQNWYYT